MSKPVVKQRPKPPPYPRPVPQLVIEELAPRSEDIAWSVLRGGGHYSDEDDKVLDTVEVEQRAAKRRRIEICAQACLRGEPLYIMSAQLKGPIDKGWKNPWAKKRKGTKPRGLVEERAMEIPETARKTSPNTVQRNAVKAIAPTPEVRPASREGVRLSTKQRDIPIEHAPSPFTSRVRPIALEPSPKVPQQAKERRVEEWLRTNETYAKGSEVQVLVHSSPTPSSRPHRTPKQTPINGNRLQASQSEPPPNLSPMVNLQRSAMSLQARDTPKNPSDAEQRVQKLSRDMQNIIAEPIAKPAGLLQDEVKRLVVPVDKAQLALDESRAEFAILKAKRRVLQTAPADAHMSPFEFRKVSGPDTESGDIDETSVKIAATRKDGTKTDDTRSEDERPIAMVAETFDHGSRPLEDEVFVTAPQPVAHDESTSMRAPAKLPNAVSKGSLQHHEEEALVDSTPRPVLSTAVSDISTSNLLPSAQPRLEPQLSVSSATHDEKLISIKPMMSAPEKPVNHKDNPVQTAEAGKGTNTNTTMATPVEVSQDSEPPEGLHLVLEASTPTPAYNAADLNTQEMLANIEPLDLSTVKKPKASTKQDTPVTVTKTRSEKKRKKASFAADTSIQSSNGSIKAVMKARISKQLNSPPLYLLGKDYLDIEVSDDEKEIARKRLCRHSDAINPKGILKSTNPSSSPTSLKRSKSGFAVRREQEQDREKKSIIPIESGQNVMNEDNFDLDAAIDDLGSFLGTWDAEKEASSLDIEL